MQKYKNKLIHFVIRISNNFIYTLKHPFANLKNAIMLNFICGITIYSKTVKTLQKFEEKVQHQINHTLDLTQISELYKKQFPNTIITYQKSLTKEYEIFLRNYNKKLEERKKEYLQLIIEYKQELKQKPTKVKELNEKYVKKFTQTIIKYNQKILQILNIYYQNAKKIEEKYVEFQKKMQKTVDILNPENYKKFLDDSMNTSFYSNKKDKKFLNDLLKAN